MIKKENINSRGLWLILLFISQTFVMHAQCDITNFTATPANGSCLQEAQIAVQVTGATDCTSSPTFAEVRIAGTATTIDLITLTTAGAGTFFDLETNTYDVIVSQGNETSILENITVNNIYTQMTLTPNATNTSCSPSDSNNPSDGTASVSLVGGIGPYTYDLRLSGSVIASSGSIAATDFTFTGLAPGAYNIRVTDNNATCISSEVRSTTVSFTTYTPLVYYYERTRPDEDTCGLVTYRLAARFGNTGALGSGTAASATLNGGATIFGNIISNTATTSVFDFTGLTPGDILTNITVNDVCNSITRPDLVIPVMPEDYLDYQLEATKTADCTDGVNIRVDAGINSGLPPGRTSFAFQINNTLEVFREDPAGSGTFVLLETRTSSHLSHSGGTETFTVDDPAATYRLVATDDCHTVERIFTPDITFENPLLSAELLEGLSKLEGTSSIEIRKRLPNGTLGTWGEQEPLSYPITATITRTDGSSNITINPAQPYSLGGVYTYNFPMTAVFVDPNPTGVSAWWRRPFIGNLPIGEYEIVLTDACGDTITNTIDLIEPATYAPILPINQVCATGDIVFDMGATNVVDYSQTRLYENNAGALGPLVRDISENPNNTNDGQFSAVPPGDYIMRFTGIRNRIPDPRTDVDYVNFDASINAFQRDSEYQEEVTVVEYEQVAFSATSFLCEEADPDSGILAITLTGVPIGSIAYSVWADPLDPDTDVPTQTYVTTDLTETSYFFQNLTVGMYKVRVITDCGYTEQEVTIQVGPIIFPDPILEEPVTCAGGSNEIFMPLPPSLFLFSWEDETGTEIGTGNSVTVSPETTTIYTVSYFINPALGCTTPASGTDTIEVVVFEEVSVSNNPNAISTTCEEPGVSYTVTLELDGVAPFSVVSGTGAPGLWVDNVWTSDNIPANVNYNVRIVDANACNVLEVSGNASMNCEATDIAISKEVNVTEAGVGDEVIFTITAANIGQFNATNISIEDALPAGYTYVSNTTSSGEYNQDTGLWLIEELIADATSTLEIVVAVTSVADYTNIATLIGLDQRDLDETNDSDDATIVLPGPCIKVNELFTPIEVDGINDFFTIDCIENFPDNKLEIYNRWGILVYKANRYLNTWDGTSAGRATISEVDKVPAGTYYYVLDLGIGEEPRSGWLYVN